MVRDLNIPVEITVCPITREIDGLAMSSRNAYLDPQQRKAALVLHRSLQEIKRQFESGERNASKLMELGREVFAQEPSVRLDYLEIVNPDNLEAVDRIDKPALVAAAAYLGNTRLIDNFVLLRDSVT
jgi:pantoate--beta-alanine ligase